MRNTEESNSKKEIKLERGKVLYRVVEHLFSPTLPIHGNTLERYDTRIVYPKISNKEEAQILVEKIAPRGQTKKIISPASL